MKTLGRVLIILTVFVILMGITYLIVSTSSSSSSMSGPGVVNSEGFALPTRERPEMDSADLRGGGWMFGLVKNFGIVAVIAAMIVIPKSFMRKKALPVRVK